jgi:hypothetical protein
MRDGGGQNDGLEADERLSFLTLEVERDSKEPFSAGKPLYAIMNTGGFQGPSSIMKRGLEGAG